MTMDMSITLSAHAAKELGRDGRRVDTAHTVAPQQGVAPLPSTQSANAPGSVASAQSLSSVSADDVKAAVEQMKDFAQVMSRQLQFDVDDDSGRTVIRVLDKDSGDIIRQIPPKEVLALAKHMKEMMEEESANVAGKGMRDQPVGLFVKTQA